MKRTDLERTDLHSMSADELLRLHEKVAAKLAEQLMTKKSLLENRLRQLTPQTRTGPLREKSGRRPYPRIYPKFRNPELPSETWTGRGKQPRWLTAQLRSGKRVEDFRIEPPFSITARRSASSEAVRGSWLLSRMGEYLQRIKGAASPASRPDARGSRS